MHAVPGAADGSTEALHGIVIGAPWGLCDNQSGDNGNAAGEVYLIYGGHAIGGASRTVTLSSPDRTVGLLLEGVEMGDNTGLSVAGAGDVDGDGYADLLIGAPDASPDAKTGAGKAYLVFGGPDLGGSSGLLDLAALTSSDRVLVFNGAAAGDHAGRAVAGAGDVNGDGLGDILIGAPDADPSSRTEAGAVYLVYGSESFAFDAPFDLSALDGANGVVFQGAAAGDHAGWSVAGVGDAKYTYLDDPGGLADLLIGAPDAEPSGHEDAGTAYLIFGKSSIATYGTFDLSTEVVMVRGRVFLGAAVGDRAGAAVSAAGDADGDGWADLLIGAPAADPEVAPNPPVDNGGQAYLIYSGQLGSGAEFQLPPTGDDGATLAGNDADEALGRAVSDSGDLNGDGISDRLVGANGGADSPGEVFFVPGDEEPATSAAYKAWCKPGDAPKTAIGSLSAADPPSRCWINYSDGSYYDGASLETVTLDRLPSITGFPPNTAAGVLWRIETNRTGAWPAFVTFKYLDSEILGLSEWSLELYQATAPSGAWTLVSNQSINPYKNQIRAEISQSGLYYALAATGSSTPGTIHVYPDGLWTIQDAIDAVDPDGTVMVYPGTYRENIHFSGKDLVLQSTDPDNPAIRASTILDGAARGTVITFEGSETEACVVEGFTITNGAALNGAGITGWGSGGQTHATIRKNIIVGNTASQAGGGGIFGCAGPIEENVIRANAAPLYGGGLFVCFGPIEKNHICDNVSGGVGGGLSDCFGPICNNLIYRNEATNLQSPSTTAGGALAYCNASIVNNTIWANGADATGGGLAHCESSYRPTAWGVDLSGAVTTIINDIVWENSAPTGAQISSSDAPTYCCIQGWTGGGTGNITADPDGPKMLFPENGDVRLETGSPCVNAGTTIAGLNEDYEGQTRPNGAFDIGADEYYAPDPMPPARPADFQAEVLSDNTTVRLTWTANSPPPSGGYNLYRSNCYYGPFERIVEDVQETTYDDVDVQPGPFYYYAATAAAASGTQSGLSAKANGTPVRTVVLDAGHGPAGGATGLWSYTQGSMMYEGDLTYQLVSGFGIVHGGIKQWLERYENTHYVKVKETRLYPWLDPSPEQRAEDAKNSKAQVFLSIHFNDGAPDPNQMLALVYRLDKREEFHPEVDAQGNVTKTADQAFADCFDQYNLEPDINFAQRIFDGAYAGYDDPLCERGGYTDPNGAATGVRSIYTEVDQFGNPTVGHWGVLRDSRLWRNSPNAIPPLPAAILEVNFIANDSFHWKWNEGWNFPSERGRVAEAITQAILDWLPAPWWDK